MQISSPPKTHRSFAFLVVIPSVARNLLLACAAATLLFVTAAPAQTLARPGWAGSGLTHESWWQNAIFYCIQPQHFQDSDGDGAGDLAGIAQRMDYLQSLGVDAILLEPPFNDAGFDDLLAEASHRHIRIVVGIQSSTPEITLAAARSWLTRGAAGIAVTALPHPDPNSPNAAADFLHQLRQLTDSLPGQRVLIASEMAVADATQTGRNAAGAELVEPILGLDQGSDDAGAALFRAGLADRLGFAQGYLRKSGDRLNARAAAAQADGAPANGFAKAVATMLLATRGGVLLQYGQELGADTSGPAKTMQWTPSNAAPTKPPAPAKPAPQPKPPVQLPPGVYGAYVPYVPPVAKSHAKPGVEAPPPIDPDSLMGFTTGALPSDEAVPSDHAEVNVAVEDAAPSSLLNFYRRLIQLHHGNPSLHTGTPYVLNYDAQDALVWLRRAPNGARTAGTVIVACNLSAKPLTLNLNADLAQLHLRPGELRPLLASDYADAHNQTTGDLTLAPYAVFLGELHH